MTLVSTRLRLAAYGSGLDVADLAELVDADPRTTARWLADGTELTPDTHLFEVVAVLEALAGVFRPQAARDWLFTPNSLLEDGKPGALLAQDAPGARRVLGMISALGEGVSV